MQKRKQSHVPLCRHRACTNGCRMGYGEQRGRGIEDSAGGVCLCKKESRAMCHCADIVLARMDAGWDMASNEAEESKIPQVVSAYAKKKAEPCAIVQKTNKN